MDNVPFAFRNFRTW